MRDYTYGKIVSIEYVKTDEVWDINTITHALSANGIWVHNCVTPQEACLEFGGNIFPKKELQEQLARIRTNKNLSNHK
nr:MAG TPA: Terminase large subunit [Caudoviricetes sp.]